MKQIAQELKYTLGDLSAKEAANKIRQIADRVEQTGKLSLGHSYEILAQTFGFRDWNTARLHLLENLTQQAQEQWQEDLSNRKSVEVCFGHMGKEYYSLTRSQVVDVIEAPKEKKYEAITQGESGILRETDEDPVDLHYQHDWNDDLEEDWCKEIDYKSWRQESTETAARKLKEELLDEESKTFQEIREAYAKEGLEVMMTSDGDLKIYDEQGQELDPNGARLQGIAEAALNRISLLLK